MGYIDEIPNDVALVKEPDFERSEFVDAFRKLEKISVQRPKSIVAELNVYRKYVPLLLDAYCKMIEAINKSIMQTERTTATEYDRANKRWTKEEDEEIIERICDGKHNILQLSTIFGRSPGAIKTHITELVGRKRLSQEIAGRFVGIIDGQSTDGDIRGVLFK